MQRQVLAVIGIIDDYKPMLPIPVLYMTCTLMSGSEFMPTRIG